MGNFARFGITSGGRAGKKGSKGECGEAPLVILPWKRGGGNNHNKQEMWRGQKSFLLPPLPSYPTFPILCIRCNAHPQEDVYRRLNPTQKATTCTRIAFQFKTEHLLGFHYFPLRMDISKGTKAPPPPPLLLLLPTRPKFEKEGKWKKKGSRGGGGDALPKWKEANCD